MKLLKYSGLHKIQVRNTNNPLSSLFNIDSDHMALISKLLNLKDHLHKQVFMGILYRKLVIWMDLNIQSDEFVHSSKLIKTAYMMWRQLLITLCIIEVVEAINMINDFKEQLHYIPSKLFFSEVDLNTPGIYSITNEQ